MPYLGKGYIFQEFVDTYLQTEATSLQRDHLPFITKICYGPPVVASPPYETEGCVLNSDNFWARYNLPFPQIILDDMEATSLLSQ